ncbi:MAG: hypothetical protein QGH85_01035 [Candidatus Pacebacteria bacterium]|jgi:hypothetical protein|nr:hypothetical protein [Parcubacteria group bacterium]MDP6249434.1 hypothetical protein [Candidatus Paceibacterota bacterium]MDP7159584.1 hypothetical protein [Candidatus Paceibacterota bacterium]MDP7366303.1 hypothetical protein [Candidatus Paceibacterota bacterium]MDP7466192.1 hypothetical protein [Candidatus Paceibacterota bacterium]
MLTVKKQSYGFRTVLSQCCECKGFFKHLWPFGDGVCDKCLVENFTAKEVMQKTCGCLHNDIRKLFLKV